VQNKPHDLRVCAGIDGRPERRGSGGDAAEAVAREAKTDRTQLRRVLDQIEAGDVLMVTWLDRLVRSTRDLLNTLAVIADRKAGFRSPGGATDPRDTRH
jgi:DNA invertase Pin-like site-specific DNA recombinase